MRVFDKKNWIVLVLWAFMSTSWAEAQLVCEAYSIQVFPLEKIEACLVQEEVALPSEDESEGASAIIYRTQEDEVVFVRAMWFFSYGNWYLTVDLRRPSFAMADVLINNYLTDTGELNFSEKASNSASASYILNFHNSEMSITSVKIPRSENGWEIAFDIRESLSDKEFWKSEITSLIDLSSGE